jgi:hypothetical protein
MPPNETAAEAAAVFLMKLLLELESIVGGFSLQYKLNHIPLKKNMSLKYGRYYKNIEV